MHQLTDPEGHAEVGWQDERPLQHAGRELGTHALNDHTAACVLLGEQFLESSVDLSPLSY